MKKFLITVFMLLLCLSFVACGKTKNDLTNAPLEEYVISCLRKVPGITDIEAVTETNDPNGKLNKAGGYISQVYFAYSLVNQKNIYGNTVIEKGTSAGGSIEVYKNVDDAKKREEYLTAFDGSILSSGSHCIIGTIIIRISDELTASQQKTLKNNIIFSLKGETNSINMNIGTAEFNDNSTDNETFSYYGKYFMEKYANSYIYILDENTVIFHDAFDNFDLQGYDKFEYTYIPANSEYYENTYPMLKIDMTILYPNELSHYEFIHILDESTIMYNAEKFSN